MAYVSTDYVNNPKAPAQKWTCTPASSLGPFSEAPAGNITKGPNFCGQCVSYVKQVCPSLPATSGWKKGAVVKDNKEIVAGTVIATFNDSGKYFGHAAIYVRQDSAGVYVHDQYVSGANPKPVGPRTLRWNAPRNVNNGSCYYVVE
jgi:hypothetical protein